MPNDNVFTRSHDEAIGMIGNTLDFIAGESAKAAEIQRQREFTEKENQKSRDAQAEQSKLSDQRQLKAQTFGRAIDALNLGGTPPMRKAAQEMMNQVFKDPELTGDILGPGGIDLVGTGLKVKDILKNPAMKGFETYLPNDPEMSLTMPQFHEAQQLWHADKAAREARTHDEKWKILEMVQRMLGQGISTKSQIGLGIATMGLQVGKDAAGNTIYDPQYAGHADPYLSNLEEVSNEINTALAQGNMPGPDLIKRYNELGNPVAWVKASKEKSRSEFNAGKIREAEQFTAGVREKIKPIVDEEKKLQQELLSVQEKTKSRQASPYPTLTIGRTKEEARAIEIKKRLKVLQERRERYEYSIKTQESVAKGRKAYAAPTNDPLNLLGK